MYNPLALLSSVPNPFSRDTHPAEMSAFEYHSRQALLSAAVSAATVAGFYTIGPGERSTTVLRASNALSPRLRAAIDAATLIGTVGVPVLAYGLLDDKHKQNVVAGSGLVAGLGGSAYLNKVEGRTLVQNARQVGKAALLGVGLASGTDALRHANAAYRLFSEGTPRQT